MGLDGGWAGGEIVLDEEERDGSMQFVDGSIETKGDETKDRSDVKITGISHLKETSIGGCRGRGRETLFALVSFLFVEQISFVELGGILLQVDS